MAAIDCIRNVLQKIPGATPNDIQEIYDSMTRDMQKAFYDGLGNPKSEFAAASEKALADHVRMVQNLATEAKENLAKRITRESVYKDPAFKGDRVAGMIEIAKRVGDHNQHATRNTLLRSLLLDLDERKNPGITDVFKGGALDREIYQAVHELSGGKELPGPRSQETKIIARAVFNLNKLEHYYYHESGAVSMNDLAGHVAHQGHDPQMLRSVGPDIAKSMEQWKADILPLLDQQKTFHRSFFKLDPDEVLNGVFENIVSEKSKVLQSEAADQFVKIVGTPSNMAKKAEMGKTLYFKDGYSQFDYNQKYGKKTLAEQINSTINTTARNTGMMQELGTNPKASWERDMIGLEAHQKARLNNFMAEMDGSTSFAGNSLGASIGSTSRQLLGMSKLSFSLPAHFGMVMTRAARLSFNGENLLSGLAKSLTSLFESIPEENREEVMRIHGIGADARAGRMWADLYHGDGLSGKMGKANELFYKINGMTPYIEGTKIAAAQELGAQFGGQAGKNFSELNPGMARSLLKSRIGPAQWDLMRSSVEQTERGPVIGSNGVRNIPHEQALGIMQGAGMIPEDAKPAEVKRMVEKFKFETQQSLAGHFANAIDTDMGAPGIREKADFLKRGTLADTVGGQALRSATQFKAFPIAMMTRWGDYAMNEIMAKESNFDKVGTITGLAASSLMLGYIGYATGELMRGRKPPDPHNPDTWLKSAAKGGTLGYLGDFLVQNIEDSGKYKGSLSTLAGPTFGQIPDVIAIGQGLLAKKDPLRKAGAEAFRVARNNTPGPWNFPLLKPAMEQLFLNEISERLNPGYLRRERTKMKENGQTAIFGH